MTIQNALNKIRGRIEARLSWFLSDYQYAVRRFKKTFGYKPDFLHPRTLNEKINWRKLYDHRPIFAVFADKVAVRKYVEGKVGPQVLIKTYQETDRPEKIDYKALPRSFVIKASHGSHWYKMVWDKEKLDRQEAQSPRSAILPLTA